MSKGTSEKINESTKLQIKILHGSSGAHRKARTTKGELPSEHLQGIA